MNAQWRILDFQGLEYIVSTEELLRHNPEWVLKIALLKEKTKNRGLRPRRGRRSQESLAMERQD